MREPACRAHLDGDRRRQPPDGPGQVLVTHAHGDHASGVPALRRRWPAHAFSKFPWPERDDEYPCRVAAASRRRRHSGGRRPTRRSCTRRGMRRITSRFWHAATRTLFCGDLVTLGTTVVDSRAAHGGEPRRQYLASLERVLALAPARLLPAHGAVIDDPAARDRDVSSTIAREREAQVLGGARGRRSHRRGDRRAHLSRACRIRSCRWRARASWRTC